MAWWQKKILRYALLRTGLLDDKALDLDHLDITLGKQNVIELKDVALNITRLSKIAQLPPGLRIETARILSLRLTVPADIYQSSISAEVDGVEIGLTLEERAEVNTAERRSRPSSPLTTRSPQHRKTHRRLPSPSPYDPGGLPDSEDSHLPTTEELAKSFLREEPAHGRRQLEASVVASDKGLDESIVSESSDGDELGVGAAVGLPGFLANFLQGIVDRLRIVVLNMEVKLETEVPGDGKPAVPLTLCLNIGKFELVSAGVTDADATIPDNHGGERQIKLADISLSLLSDAAIFSELSELRSFSSPTASSQRDRSPVLARSLMADLTLSPSQRSYATAQGRDEDTTIAEAQKPMLVSTLTVDADRYADAGDDNIMQGVPSAQHDLEIQPGDDNVSWGSRRRESDGPVADLWNSMASKDDLPDSLILHQRPIARVHSARDTRKGLAEDARYSSEGWQQRIQGPGSWPRLDESPDRVRPQRSPDSSPAIDPQVRPFPPWEQESDHMTNDVVDNKKTALHASLTESQLLDAESESPVESESESGDDLTTSQFFTHEQAESMYMSAMSQSTRMHVPGGWSADDINDSSRAADTRSPPAHLPAIAESMEKGLGTEQADLDQPYHTPGNSTPRLASPVDRSPLDQVPIHIPHKASRQLLHVASLHIWIPTTSNLSEDIDSPPVEQSTTSRNTSNGKMPGSFSMYSEMSASRRNPASFPRQDSSGVLIPGQQSARPSESSAPLKLELGSVRCQLDMPCGRLLYRLGSKASTVLPAAKSSGSQSKASPNMASARLTVSDFVFAFKESPDRYLAEASSIEPRNNLATILCRQASFSLTSLGIDIDLGAFSMYLGSSRCLSFSRSSDMMASAILTEHTPDIAVTLRNQQTPPRQPTKEISIQTLPLVVMLDIPAMEETFQPFGGLSGLLEAGNSILLDSGIVSPAPSPIRSPKGVRFEGDLQSLDVASELKVNAIIGGVDARLQGNSCAVDLRSTAVKAFYRAQGAVVTIAHVEIAIPRTSENDSDGAMSIELFASRLEYLPTPQDKDLERLLSLITPSKDKYDTDDDILIDTLLRQRKKGAVARASVNEVRVYVEDWSSVQALSSLAEELSKFSAVTKYLPEDERPGLLTLIRVKDFNARLPVNKRFGELRCRLTDIHCAQISLPALVAVSVGDVNASQADHGKIARSLVQSAGLDNLPILMARMLGDEIEPTLKIKLYNICIEYSVPVVVALTDLAEGMSQEEIVMELAQSVVNLMPHPNQKTTRDSSPMRDARTSSSKKMNIDLLIHDSAIGLSPQKLASKALLVLTDAQLSVTYPPEPVLAAQLELRNAGLFIADQTLPDDADIVGPLRSSPSNTATNAKLTLLLSKRGYVSVGSIMAAKVDVRAQQSDNNGTTVIEVGLTNELLLLETCADSTQTLIATLSGLLPPTPPAKQPMYQTQPMTIEEMMASFTGDAFEKPVRPSETLFDVDEEPGEDALLSFGMGKLAENDDLLSESEMSSSLYGPVSGVLGAMGDSEEEDDPDHFPATVESLLEDDPFEMTNSPMDARLSDKALMRELEKQCRRPLNDKAVDLGIEEFEDLGFDALGAAQSILGVPNRFNAPVPGRGTVKKPGVGIEYPFKLKVRDLHIIWNIYDGYDWQRTREGITEAVEQVELRAEERKARRRQSAHDTEDDESVIADFLFNSIYIGVPSRHDAHDLRRQINRDIDELVSETESVPVSGMSRPATVYSASGRPVRSRQKKRLKLERSRAHKIAFELKGVSADILVFPEQSTEVVSSVDVRVRDIEVFDNVPTSTWRKFLTHLSNEPGDREMAKPMLHLELFNVRTLEKFAASEIVLHVSLLPLRLHVDQDALDFITRFFEFKDAASTASTSSSEQPFIQRLEVDTVDLRLDYKPKKVDYVGLRSGHTTEFMNFVILDAADIRLKHAISYGIKGFDPIHKTLNDIWMPDVKRNQLPTVLAGLAPVRSLVNIGSGVRDIVAIPIREYQKDGRIMRSVQKGAFQFGKTTAAELARLGAKVAMGTQTMLQGAEGYLSPATDSAGRPSPMTGRSPDQAWHDVDAEDEEHESRAISAYANQPIGLIPGLRSAQRYLEYDLLTARDALIAVQGEVLESEGPSSAATAVARHAPTIILRPIIGATRAIGTTLLGVGNQIDRENMRRVEDKYKRR